MKRLGTCFLIWLALSRMALAADTPLADAAEKDDARAIRELLRAKANVNAPQADGMTTLHWAVQHEDVATVEMLLAAKADVQAKNRYGVTPLAIACTTGSGPIVEKLLAAGADANGTLPGGETPLMTAARTGRVGPVKALLARGADVNARERKDQTPVMWAAAEGNLEVVDCLLEAGADYRTALSSGFTPFFFAVREGHSSVVFRLLAAGIDVNETMRPDRSRGNTRGRSTNALLLAIENGHFELALALLKAGANPNDLPSGFSALHAMTWVRKPIRGDGDPPPRGSGTASSLEMVRQLVAAGADINTRLEKGTSGRGKFTTTGSTPFLMAARNCDIPLMRLFFDLGADPRIPNADEASPLLAAAGVGALGDGDESAGTLEEAVEACKLLIDWGADVNAVDNNGETAMHGAAYQSRWQLVQLLADRGADIPAWNQKNKWGWTPLMIAQGHRPGNFRPDPATIVAIEKVFRSKGMEPPKAVPHQNRPNYK
ncbi:MAG TPA: ankyrin repeat domain-containing protein [Pirellulaceae bacterium]